jgi:F-type H+-transporting ATPase subunit b
LTSAKAEIEQEANRVKDELRSQVGSVALAGAAKIIGREIDEKAHADLLDELVSRI